MKRILSLISVLAVMMLSCITVSAASETKFKLKVVSQNDMQAVLSFDYVSGSSVAAMDFDVVVNESKLKVTKITDGNGLLNAKMQSGVLAVSFSNVDKSPASVTMAMTPGYRNVNGSDMFIITVKKLVKGDINADDINIVITNCENDTHEKNVTSVIEELGDSNGNTATDPSSAASQPSDISESSSSTSDEQEKPSESKSENSESTEAVTKGESEKAPVEDKGLNKTAIIIICAVAVVAGGAVATVIIIKKKKSVNENKEG